MFLLFYFILLFFYVEFMHIIHKPTGLTPGLCVGGVGRGWDGRGGDFFNLFVVGFLKKIFLMLSLGGSVGGV